MPPFHSIAFSFEKRAQRELVRAFYFSFFGSDISFDRVLPWGCDAGLTLDEIISWNQHKLDCDFVLGPTEDCSHDYRQPLLKVAPFSQCRLLIMNEPDSFSMECIVPEDETTFDTIAPLLRACHRVWRDIPVCAIQTFNENSGSSDFRNLIAGAAPQALWFAFLNDECLAGANLEGFKIEKLARGALINRW